MTRDIHYPPVFNLDSLLVNQLGKQLRDQICSQFWGRVKNQIQNSLYDQCRNELCIRLWSQIDRKLQR